MSINRGLTAFLIDNQSQGQVRQSDIFELFYSLKVPQCRIAGPDTSGDNQQQGQVWQTDIFELFYSLKVPQCRIAGPDTSGATMRMLERVKAS